MFSPHAKTPRPQRYRKYTHFASLREAEMCSSANEGCYKSNIDDLHGCKHTQPWRDSWLSEIILSRLCLGNLIYPSLKKVAEVVFGSTLYEFADDFIDILTIYFNRRNLEGSVLGIKRRNVKLSFLRGQRH
jgi:hypothetical protein